MRTAIGGRDDLARRVTPEHEIASEQAHPERFGTDVGDLGDHVPVVLQRSVLDQHHRPSIRSLQLVLPISATPHPTAIEASTR